MGSPLQLMTGPVEVYVAPTGEAFPDNDETPAGNWVKLGTSGMEDIGEGGVTVRSDADYTAIRTDGSTGPRKILRTSEDLFVEFMLVDSSLEHVHELFDQATITDTAAGSGTPGDRAIPLYRGAGEPTDVALLVKSAQSPYGAALTTQYEVPVAALVADSIEQVWTKGDVVKWRFLFQAKEDPAASTAAERFGRLRMQDAVAV